MPSAAKAVLDQNLTKVDDILSFHDKVQNPAVGAPPTADRSLVLGGAVLAYAAWEGYVELLAIEATDHLADHLAPNDVEATVKAKVEAKSWDLAGDGWRQVWKDRVKLKAYGDGVKKFGLNDANTAGVQDLFALVGFDPFVGVSWQNMSPDQVQAKLDTVYTVRCQIAHTALAPDTFGINDARGYRDFIARLAQLFDESVRSKVFDKTHNTPWPAA